MHQPQRDAEQVAFHNDLSGDSFCALAVEPRRVYSCACYRDPGMTLAQAQLEHICRKLRLQQRPVCRMALMPNKQR